YIAMHLSGLVGIPLLYMIGMSMNEDMTPQKMQVLASAYWVVISFFIALIIILLILRKAEPVTKIEKAEPLPFGPSILWAIGGIFLAFFAQMIAISIETAIGIEPGSENTEAIIDIITILPIVMIVSSILGPILEEIVFRKIIFGSLYNRFSFLLSALISSML